jgi:hypothetical protein
MEAMLNAADRFDVTFGLRAIDAGTKQLLAR